VKATELFEPVEEYQKPRMPHAGREHQVVEILSHGCKVQVPSVSEVQQLLDAFQRRRP
jgi:hypothetical protein